MRRSFLAKSKSSTTIASLDDHAEQSSPVKKRSSLHAKEPSLSMLSIHESTITKEALEAAQNEAAQLKQKLNIKSLFVRSVSHEIRTPLNVVFAALLWLELESESMNEEFRETISMTKESCVVAVDILNDMLAYEKIDGNILTLETSPVAIVPFLMDVIKPFTIQAKQKKIQLAYKETDVPLDVSIQADEHKLQQIIRNLISNALKFTLPGGNVSVKAMLVTYDTTEWIRIEVIDDGYGLSLENQNKLFKEIVQFSAKEQQHGGGSGLGLYISKGIVDLHNGKIGVTSEGLGCGCTFYLEFPKITSVPTELERSFSRTSSSSLSHQNSDRFSDVDTLRKLRVLVVDDSPICRKMMTRLLHRFAIDSVEAGDGTEAIEKVREAMFKNFHFDGIIMDSEMPKMNGLQSSLAIRELGFAGRIYGCTGNVNKELVETFLSHGADKIYMKPLDDKDFKSILKDLGNFKLTQTPVARSRAMSTTDYRPRTHSSLKPH